TLPVSPQAMVSPTEGSNQGTVAGGGSPTTMVQGGSPTRPPGVAGTTGTAAIVQQTITKPTQGTGTGKSPTAKPTGVPIAPRASASPTKPGNPIPHATPTKPGNPI